MRFAKSLTCIFIIFNNRDEKDVDTVSIKNSIFLQPFSRCRYQFCCATRNAESREPSYICRSRFCSANSVFKNIYKTSSKIVGKKKYRKYLLMGSQDHGQFQLQKGKSKFAMKCQQIYIYPRLVQRILRDQQMHDKACF